MGIKKFFNEVMLGLKASMNPTVGTADFILDDPAVSLREIIAIPPMPSPCPVFVVAGNPDDKQVKQVYATVAFSLSFVQPALLHPLLKWARTNSLQVYPVAGNDFNAYYDGDNLKFFCNPDPSGNMIYTCESPDIVAHELGHAILDAIRPDLWNVACVETGAFHEAFGDMMAILSAMHHDSVLKCALNETKNDLRISNIISRLAEQMGIAIFKITGGRAGMQDALRNAVNNFNYVDPEKIPTNAHTDSHLSSECHSFSRVFTGAWYEALMEMYRLELQGGVDPYHAITTARDAMTNLFLKSLVLAPLTPKFFASVANAMLVSARNNAPKYEAVIAEVFKKRNILQNVVKSLDNKNFADINLNNVDHVFSLSYSKVIRTKGQATKMIIPKDHKMHALGGISLEGVEVEIPHETYMEFNQHGNMINNIDLHISHAQKHAMEAVEKLIQEDNIEFLDKLDNTRIHKKTHAVINNKLVRLYHN